MKRRRTALAASILCSAVALAACGGSSSSSSTSSTPALSVSQATTLAGQINLTSADLPGYSSQANPVTASDKASAATLAACSGGVSPTKEIVDINSPQFSAGSGLAQRQASSNVTVLPTAADVQQDLKALTSAKGHTCLSSSLNAALTHTGTPGVTFSSGTITTLPVSTAGTDGGFGARVTVNATAQGLHIPFYVDVFGFAKSSTQVELETFGINKPFPAAEETRLITLLIGRANAHVPAS